MVEWMSCPVKSKDIFLVCVYERVSLNLEPALYCFMVWVRALDVSDSLLGIAVVDPGI